MTVDRTASANLVIPLTIVSQQVSLFAMMSADTGNTGAHGTRFLASRRSLDYDNYQSGVFFERTGEATVAKYWSQAATAYTDGLRSQTTIPVG